MGNKLIIPSPQFKYLEPFKNRVFQYDSKHSNLFLSQYVNQILNVVGNDCIVRGLEITPVLNVFSTGATFTVNPGALIQDLTYFELPSENELVIDDLVSFPNFWLIIYTNWRYLNSVYDNDLKLEATFYNSKTRKSISTWNSFTNRIILGVYEYDIQNDKITYIREINENIYFQDNNCVKNGFFDQGTIDFWTPINASVTTVENGGVEDTAYCQVQPIANEFQGIAQVVTTKPGFNYEVSIYAKSDAPTIGCVMVNDGDQIYNFTAKQIKLYKFTTTTDWKMYSFQFKAYSTKSVLYFFKYDTNLVNKIYFDHLICLEYIEPKKKTDINKVKLIDGGDIEEVLKIIGSD